MQIAICSQAVLSVWCSEMHLMLQNQNARILTLSFCTHCSKADLNLWVCIVNKLHRRHKQKEASSELSDSSWKLHLEDRTDQVCVDHQTSLTISHRMLSLESHSGCRKMACWPPLPACPRNCPPRYFWSLWKNQPAVQISSVLIFH